MANNLRELLHLELSVAPDGFKWSVWTLALAIALRILAQLSQGNGQTALTEYHIAYAMAILERGTLVAELER